MGKKKLSQVELYDGMMQSIKAEIQKQVNNEYTEIKLQYLDMMEYRLEAKRNEVVKDILDSIDIMFRQNEISAEPTIQIKIVKK